MDVFKGRLSNLYRKHNKTIETTLNRLPVNQFWEDVHQVFNYRSEQNRLISREIIELNALNKLEVNIQGLTSSYMHMTLNRLFKSRPRFQEMIMYYVLHKFYVAKRARTKQFKDQPLTV